MTDEQNLTNGQNLNTALSGSVQSSTNPALSAVQMGDYKEEKDTTPKSLIKVGKTTYAVGLFWQPLQDVDDPIPEIRDTMESDPTANLYTIHYGRSPQYGIGKTEKGHKEALPVASVAVLDALSDRSSFVAVFKVEEGWWFLVSRNDLILPEEDVLYQTEQEAKDAFNSMMAVPDWGYRIAPASWDVDDSEEIELEALLKKGTQVRLYSLGAVRGAKVLIIIALVLIAVISAAVYAILNIIEKKESAPTFIAPVAPKADFSTAEPQRETEKPWQKLVSVPEFLDKCWSVSYQLKVMNVPGWTLGNIICEHSGVKTAWTRKSEPYSRVAWIEVALQEQYKIKADSISMNQTGTEVQVTIKFDPLPIAPSSVATPTLDMSKLRKEVYDISQNLKMNISTQDGEVTVSPPTPPQGVPNTQTIQPSKVYKYLSFSFSSSMDPPAWEAFFQPFTGLEVTKIEYNPTSDSAATSNNWKYEGRIYEKN